MIPKLAKTLIATISRRTIKGYLLVSAEALILTPFQPKRIKVRILRCEVLSPKESRTLGFIFLIYLEIFFIHTEFNFSIGFLFRFDLMELLT